MDKKRKIIKYIILANFVFCLLCLTGCNNSNIFKVLDTNISKVEQTLDNVHTIDTSDLIIDDFMNENELYEIDTENFEFNSNSDHLNDYVSKLSILNNNVYSTIKINDEIYSSKNKILNKCAYIKHILKNCDNSKLDVNAHNALKDINKNLMENNTRVSLTRNEINNYLSSVKNLKEQYNKKTDQLNSRYTKLQGALNTRNTYYKNMYYNLEQIEYILCDECDINNYEYTKNETNKTWLNKNIDTYENAGTNFFGLPGRQKPYTYNNYYGYPNGYGVGMYNGYGYMYGGYGMGIPPYSYGWGYRIPNINTYGGYRNIDTYRNFRNKDNYEYDYDLKEIPEIYEPVKNPNVFPIPNENNYDNEKNINNQNLDTFPIKRLRPVPLEDESNEVFVDKKIIN